MLRSIIGLSPVRHSTLFTTLSTIIYSILCSTILTTTSMLKPIFSVFFHKKPHCTTSLFVVYHLASELIAVLSFLTLSIFQPCIIKNLLNAKPELYTHVLSGINSNWKVDVRKCLNQSCCFHLLL